MDSRSSVSDSLSDASVLLPVTRQSTSVRALCKAPLTIWKYSKRARILVVLSICDASSLDLADSLLLTKIINSVTTRRMDSTARRIVLNDNRDLPQNYHGHSLYQHDNNRTIKSWSSPQF